MKEKSKEVGTSDLFRNAVFGDNATVVVGNGNVQNIKNAITQNDFGSLAEELRKHAVQEEDIASLKIAIDADVDAPELDDKKLGANVRGWVKKMLSKTTDAVWNINLGVAGGLLTEALKAYYGWF